MTNTQTQTKPAHTPESYSDIIDPQVLVDIITERERLKDERDELLEAAKNAVTALKDHIQYDNPEDEPSLELIALEACRAAIAKAEKD